MKNRKFILWIFITFIINYGLDRFTKYLASIYLKGKIAIKLFKDLIIIIYVENSGAILSFGSNWYRARRADRVPAP
jgi:lipoprotein signal peptidase